MANTPNYGLYKPDRADTTVEVDTSLANNFTTIDTKIKANEDGLASHESSTTAHDSANITHSSGSVKDELDSLDTRVTDIETNGVGGGTIPDDLNNRLVAVETTNDTQDDRITDVENNVNGMLAPTTFDELANQTFDYDTLRFGYVDNKLTPINTELDDHASQLAENTSQLNDITINAKRPPTPQVGCKGDGATDDSAALQNIINYVSSLGGGTVLLPVSTFIVSNIQVPSNVTLKGSGIRSTTLKNNGQANPVLWAGSLSTPAIGVSIEGLTIDGQGTATNGIKLIYFVNGSKVKDVYITNAGSNLYITNSWYSNITNVQSNNATYGIEIDCTAGAVNGVKFTNCYSNYHSQNALYMHGASGSRAVSFDGCTFEHSTSYGINMIDHMDGTVFNGCYIENNDLGDSVPRQAYISLGYAGSDGGINFIGGQVSNVSNGIGIDFEQGNALTIVGTHFSWNGQGARPTNQVKSLAGFTSILSPSVDGYANGGSQNDFNVTSNSSIVQGNGVTTLNNTQASNFTINTSFNLNSLKVTSSYDMTVSGIVPVLLCDATSGILNVNNFRASLCKYARFIVKKIDASTNPVIVKESFNGNKIDNTQFYYLKNQYDWVEYVSDGTQFYKVASGVAETTTTFNGDGAMTSKTLPHGLNNIPSRFSVYSNSVDAGNAGIKYVTADATNITVFFNNPPITGTNNVSLRWKAEM